MPKNDGFMTFYDILQKNGPRMHASAASTVRNGQNCQKTVIYAILTRFDHFGQMHAFTPWI